MGLGGDLVRTGRSRPILPPQGPRSSAMRRRAVNKQARICEEQLTLSTRTRNPDLASWRTIGDAAPDFSRISMSHAQTKVYRPRDVLRCCILPFPPTHRRSDRLRKRYHGNKSPPCKTVYVTKVDQDLQSREVRIPRPSSLEHRIGWPMTAPQSPFTLATQNDWKRVKYSYRLSDAHFRLNLGFESLV